MISNVKKSTLETVRLRRNGEWATIAYEGWQHGSQEHQAGEILIHSSFGSWAYQWSHLGQPFPRFLLSVDFDYFMGKLTGERREFDYYASLALWKKHLVMARRTHQLTESQLREIWDDSCMDYECGSELFVHRLEASRPLELRDHPLWSDLACYVTGRKNEQAQGFWRELWPLFLATLTDGVEAANEPEMAAA